MSFLEMLRAQLCSQISLTASIGIDRLAVKLHSEQPWGLSALQHTCSSLGGLFELALDPRLGQLLHQHCGWPKAVLSPIFNLRAKLP